MAADTLICRPITKAYKAVRRVRLATPGGGTVTLKDIVEAEVQARVRRCLRRDMFWTSRHAAAKEQLRIDAMRFSMAYEEFS